jgi:hypothetical protein
LLITALCLGLILIGGTTSNQVSEDDPARAATLIRDAIQARGGDRYLSIRSLVGEGEYTPFLKGVSGLPQHFVDYIVYPDRERTEVQKGKFIQTNTGANGWIFDAQQKTIKDQTEQQVKRWQQGIRFDLDNVLRRGWKEEGVKLAYLGQREAWRNTFSEAVRINFSDGATVTVHFDNKSKLPLMTEFKTIGEEGPAEEQIRFYRWFDAEGVKFPKIQDSYRDGKQSARVYYETVKINIDTPDKLFAKPGSFKEVKH